jgi:leader peptidase (prepilin peptidase)/N-methyltransferase
MEVEREAYKKSRKESDEAEEEREWTGWQIRVEMGKEMLFLLIPMALGLACVYLAWKVQPVANWWAEIAGRAWVACMLGSILGGLVGGFTVWFTRIAGSLGFGKEAMGMGDVDLMVAVGAVMGAGPAIVVFFFAPFFGIAIAIYMLFLARKREMPYGPYLSLATAFVMLFYCPIANYLAPGLKNMAWMIGRLMSG